MESAEEIDGVVRITCKSLDGQARVVEAKRLIKAYGLRVMPNDPLEISSARVQSVSPDYCDVRSGDMRESDTPVWIIGGGKTAMDTAHALITTYPGREVNLVAGGEPSSPLATVCFPPEPGGGGAAVSAPPWPGRWAGDSTEPTRLKSRSGSVPPTAPS